MSAHSYQSRDSAARDPLLRPLTFEQVMRRTGRSRRTITSWITSGLLTPYHIPDGHRTVRVFSERQVLEVHKAKNQAAAATRLNLKNQRKRAEGTPKLFADVQPPAVREFMRVLLDCAEHPGLRAGFFRRHLTPSPMRWSTNDHIIEFDNGSRLFVCGVETLGELTHRSSGLEFHLVLVDEALPADVLAYLATRLRAAADSPVPVLGGRVTDGRVFAA